MTKIVELNEASAYDRKHYGITYRGAFIYHVTGKGLHNPTSPHRVTVWDNTVRPNTDPDAYSQYSGKAGPGAYLDPSRKGTDEPVSVYLGAESTIITANGTNTGTKASGQVYADETLEVGGFVLLRYPDGTLSNPFRVTARPVSDPVLIPVS